MVRKVEADTIGLRGQVGLNGSNNVQPGTTWKHRKRGFTVHVLACDTANSRLICRKDDADGVARRVFLNPRELRRHFDHVAGFVQRVRTKGAA